jgi:hypothetical protein
MMEFESAKYLEFIECRLELLRKLIRTGEEWRLAFIRLRLSDSERCAADEELLCEQIRILDREITSLQAKGLESGSFKSPEVDPVIDRRIRAALTQMAALHLDLKQSNKTKRAILKRSKFTINALRNLFNSLAPTYASPAASSVGTIYEESI